jgi:hypothetical protein
MKYPKSGPRAFEIPFAVNNLKPGPLLDIGQTSTVILRALSVSRNITVVDIAKPTQKVPGVNYIIEDVRKATLKTYNNIWLISTLEHVGLIAYGQKNPADDPADEQFQILRKLTAHLKPDGRLILTVPCGTPEPSPKFALYYTEAMIDRIKEAFNVTKECYITSNKGGLHKWFECKRNELRSYMEPGLLPGAVGGVAMMVIDG